MSGTMLKFHKINKTVYKNVLRYNSFYNVKSSLKDKPILYGDEIAPPVRFVMMTAHILAIYIEFRKIDLFKNENRTEFYQKINPLQKVPTMVINSTNVCDSHAISICLSEIAKKQNIYPEDPIIRAKINQMLFFNCSTLFRLDSEILSKYFAHHWPVSNKTIEEWYLALDYLEYHLNNGQWLTGNKMFLCDVSVVAVVTSILPLVSLTKRHKKVQAWIDRFESLPFYAINKRGLNILYNYIEANKYV